MIGKTIARVDEPAYEEYGDPGLLVIWFTDGTAVKVRGDGYECDGVTLIPTTAAELDAEFVEEIELAIERAWTDHERALANHWECLQMAEAYGGEDTAGYKQWYQERFGDSAFSRALKAVYLGAIREQLKQTRFFWGEHGA